MIKKLKSKVGIMRREEALGEMFTLKGQPVANGQPRRSGGNFL